MGETLSHRGKQRQEQHFFLTISKLTNAQTVHSFEFTTITETRTEPTGRWRSLPMSEMFKLQPIFLRANWYSNRIFKQPSKAKTCQQTDSVLGHSYINSSRERVKMGPPSASNHQIIYGEKAKSVLLEMLQNPGPSSLWWSLMTSCRLFTIQNTNQQHPLLRRNSVVVRIRQTGTWC